MFFFPNKVIKKDRIEKEPNYFKYKQDHVLICAMPAYVRQYDTLPCLLVWSWTLMGEIYRIFGLRILFFCPTNVDTGQRKCVSASMQHFSELLLKHTVITGQKCGKRNRRGSHWGELSAWLPSRHTEEIKNLASGRKKKNEHISCTKIHITYLSLVLKMSFPFMFPFILL